MIICHYLKSRWFILQIVSHVKWVFFIENKPQKMSGYVLTCDSWKCVEKSQFIKIYQNFNEIATSVHEKLRSLVTVDGYNNF